MSKEKLPIGTEVIGLSMHRGERGTVVTNYELERQLLRGEPNTIHVMWQGYCDHWLELSEVQVVTFGDQ